MSGYAKDPEVDEYERKQELRKTRRKPIQETIEQLSEGRGEWKTRLPILVFEAECFGIGIYGPGYAERRAARIKQNYGVDVPTTNPGQG